MTPLEMDYSIRKEHGIETMRRTIKDLEQRIKQWESGIIHNPRTEIEALSEVAMQAGAVEALWHAIIREKLEKGN